MEQLIQETEAKDRKGGKVWQTCKARVEQAMGYLVNNPPSEPINSLKALTIKLVRNQKLLIEDN